MSDTIDFSRREFVKNSSKAIVGVPLLPYYLNDLNKFNGSKINRSGDFVEIISPFFKYKIDVRDNIKAVWIENRITGKRLQFGRGIEIAFDIGLPDQETITPELYVVDVLYDIPNAGNVVRIKLECNNPKTSVVVDYKWTNNDPTLHKFVSIQNTGDLTWDRLLNVRLGYYTTDNYFIRDKTSSKDYDGDYPIPIPRQIPNSESLYVERGFPVYIDDKYFISLAHPAGIAEGSRNKILLRQYPGIKLYSGETYNCMETIYGIAIHGTAKELFLTHIKSRMRRTIRNHDKPYAIFTNFGSWPLGENLSNLDNNESNVLHSLDLLKLSQKQTGRLFDVVNIDFWVDYHGTLKEADPERFPKGLDPLGKEIRNLGMDMGLWIDGSMESWSIGGNPDPEVQNCLNYDLERPETKNEVQLTRKAFCRATEPIKSMYIDAFKYHIRHNKVRLLKFDNTSCICINPTHDHLPGLYSTEAIENGLIDFFNALDLESNDVFLMLYWGYKSPWWLLYADTLFDSGNRMEAASPSNQPSIYARDSVTLELDKGQSVANEYIPTLGKDSLGIWLSDWWWNSQIGKERWQEAFIMDMCRGSLLAQIWSDYNWLSPPEWSQLSVFINLLKNNSNCFVNPRFILGDPLKNELYGYSCSDGQHCFIAVNNVTWEDQEVKIELGENLGLPVGKEWELFRWYPKPSQLTKNSGTAHKGEIKMALRPFEIVLIEAVKVGEKQSIPFEFNKNEITTRFAHASKEIDIYINKEESNSKNIKWAIKGELPISMVGGKIVIIVELINDGGVQVKYNNLGPNFIIESHINDKIVEMQPALGKKTYPSSWQSWRLNIAPQSKNIPLDCFIFDSLRSDANRYFKAYFLPNDKL